MNVTACMWKQDSTDWLTGMARSNELACHEAKALACPPNSLLFLAGVAFAVTVLVAVQDAGAMLFYVSDTSAGAVYSLNGSGQRTLIADGFGQPHGLAVDSSGNIYVAEVRGDRISRIAPSGAVETLYSFDSIYDNPEGLAIGPDGALYVSGTIDDPYVGGLKNVYRIDLRTGQGGVYASVGLQECLALDFDAAGNLYVADLVSAQDGIIWKVTPNGQVSQFVTGLGMVYGLTVAPDGETLYAATRSSNEIWLVNPNGQSLLFATMASPWALAFDNTGQLLVSGYANGEGYVSELSPDGSQSVIATGFSSTIRGIAIPEPATLSLLALLALSGLAMLHRRRRR